jgi:hypothetical protein
MKIKNLPCLLVITFLLLACEKQTVKIETHPAEDITSTTATLVGKMIDPCKRMEEYGFYYWIEGNEVNPSNTFVKNDTHFYPGNYSATVSGLEPEKNYFFEAYATDGHETAFGEILEFRTVQAK